MNFLQSNENIAGNFFSSGGQGIEHERKRQFKILKVFDGDSLRVGHSVRAFNIRLVGIDSPEMGTEGRKGQPYCMEARRFMEKTVDKKELALKIYGTGSYGRKLAEVFVDGKNVNLEMIKAGFAQVYRGRLPKGFDCELYFKEELKAKKAGKGVWSQGLLYKSPKQWRKENPITLPELRNLKGIE